MHKTKIKICGLYRECDVDCVNRVRPDFAGFVFYPPSHRHVEREQMERFRERLDPGIPAVGVFVDAPAEQIVSYLRDGLIQIAQLHGNETEAYMRTLREEAPGCEIWKAYRIAEAKDLREARKSGADRILLDNGFGTGRCFDWRLMEDDAPDRPFILAGGLRLENVEEAMERFRPWCVDVSSGVETGRRKDPDKIREMTETVRSW
ncbi:MAG: phosphoribosylanthranilate isomerase [Eubacteriales bacterium]|nr:phosphoribosylanthranilate isomerase [Eubacteriales bacterium]